MTRWGPAQHEILVGGAQFGQFDVARALKRIEVGQHGIAADDPAAPSWRGAVAGGTRVTIWQLGTWGASPPLVGFVGEG